MNLRREAIGATTAGIYDRVPYLVGEAEAAVDALLDWLDDEAMRLADQHVEVSYHGVKALVAVLREDIG